MIDEIYRTKQGDGYLSFDEIADGLGRELCGICEEIYPSAGGDLANIFLDPDIVGEIDWSDSDGPNILNIRGNAGEGCITITDSVIVDCITILVVLPQIRRWYADYSADRAWVHLVGFSQAVAKLRSQIGSIKAQYENTLDAGMTDVRCVLSIYGAAGAAAKHQPTRALKEWALKESKVMRGAPADVARRLAAGVPGYLANASKNPGRLIYEALLASQKNPLD